VDSGALIVVSTREKGSYSIKFRTMQDVELLRRSAERLLTEATIEAVERTETDGTEEEEELEEVKKFRCIFFPKCPSSFSYNHHLKRHVADVHGGSTLSCDLCKDLKVFQSKKKRSDHKCSAHRPPKKCPRCMEFKSGANFARHVHTCKGTYQSNEDNDTRNEHSTFAFEPEPEPESAIIDTSEEFDDEFDEEFQHLATAQVQPPSNGNKRSAYLAPAKDDVDIFLQDLSKWLINSYALGTDNPGKGGINHLNKFRTFIGKVAKMSNMDARSVMMKLRGKQRCFKFLNSLNLQRIVDEISVNTSTGEELHPSTVYNQLRAFIKFLEFKVEVHECKELEVF